MPFIKGHINQESDEVLVQKFTMLKDHDALAELFNRYVELLFGVCMKYFKDHDKAQDAVMDVFEKVNKKLPNYKVENFRSWIYTVTKNHCFEVLRKKNGKNIVSLDSDIVYFEPSFHPDDKRSDEKELVDLEDCVDKLIEMQKTCVKLFYLESKSYQEITEVLKMDWKDVRSNIQNGRRNLKNCMENKIDKNSNV